MQFKSVLFAAIQVAAVVAIDLRAEPDSKPKVLTAMKVFNTVVSQSPFLVETTSTIIWTQSASPTPIIGS